MNSILCYLMLVALVIRPNRAMMIYVVGTLGFMLMWNDAEPYEYFTLAVLADLICMMFLALFNITRKILYMMGICIASIVCNLLGFIMWYTYQSPVWYVWSFTIIYTLALYIILRKDEAYVGGGNTRLHFHRANNRSDVGTSRGNLIKGGATV